MVSKREIGSKLRKQVLAQIFVPNIPIKILKDNVQFITDETEQGSSFIFNTEHELCFFKFENIFLPSLHFIRKNTSMINFPVVKVDDGAVKHILNGADVFSQGITEIDRDFNADTIVIIRNPQEAVLALAKSLKSSQELIKSKGKGLLNLHYLNDKIWNM